MFRLSSYRRLSTTVQHYKMISDSKIVYTVDLLKEKASGYLEEYDSAQACEKSFQGCKLAMMGYVKRLESTSNISILPDKDHNPWNYKQFSKLCRLIKKRVDSDMAKELTLGWAQAYVFHVKGWTQNDLSVEDVKYDLPYVFRFMDIFDRELKVDHEMASYLKTHLFNLDLDNLAVEINKENKI